MTVSRLSVALDNVLVLPEILSIPEKLLPLITKINDYRYFLVDGGRGGSKSQSIARILTYLSEQKNYRIVCGREFQNSIDESVYTIFKDLILNYNLNFEILSTQINHNKSGSSIKFRGFREQGATNIKGLEGVDILWVDEAQAITKQTLDVIIPTIRKENAKVFWTMNRHVENDPVFAYFFNRTDCLHITINYPENEHCPKALIHEAEVCKAKSESDYRHIWMGQPLAKSEDYLFSLDMIRKSLALEVERPGLHKRVLANDVARYGDCENVFTVIESRGPIFWEQIHQECFKGMGLDETVGKHLSLQRTMSIDLNVIDDDGMGGGVTDNLKGIQTTAFSSVKEYKRVSYYDRRTDGYFKLQDWMTRGWIKILNDPLLHEQLLTIKYKYAPDGTKRLFTKEEQRKDGIVSQDRSDALMMAVFCSDEVMHGDFGKNESYALHNFESKESVNMSKYARIS